MPTQLPTFPARAYRGGVTCGLPPGVYARSGRENDARLEAAHDTSFIFGDSKATKTHARTELLDTGSPATFISKQVWERMIACGATPSDGLSEIPERKWRGFHGIPLITTS